MKRVQKTIDNQRRATLTVFCQPIAGSQVVTLDKGSILFAHHLEINGRFFWSDEVDVHLGGFISAEIRAGGHGLSEGSYDSLRQEFWDPADYLEGTTDSVLVLPITEFKTVVMPPP